MSRKLKVTHSTSTEVLDLLAKVLREERARLRVAVEGFRVGTGDLNTMEGAQNQGYNFAVDDVLVLLSDPEST